MAVEREEPEVAGRGRWGGAGVPRFSAVLGARIPAGHRPQYAGPADVLPRVRHLRVGASAWDHGRLPGCADPLLWSRGRRAGRFGEPQDAPGLHPAGELHLDRADRLPRVRGPSAGMAPVAAHELVRRHERAGKAGAAGVPAANRASGPHHECDYVVRGAQPGDAVRGPCASRVAHRSARGRRSLHGQRRHSVAGGGGDSRDPGVGGAGWGAEESLDRRNLGRGALPPVPPGAAIHLPARFRG